MKRATDEDLVHLHVHTDKGSNIRMKDSTNKVKDVISYSASIGNHGVAITDHESLSAHVTAINEMEKLKKEKRIPEDFKLILGNEIYLMDENDMKQKIENKDSIKFYHFILLARDIIGHRQLRELSSRAWKDHYFIYKNMARVPTYYTDIEEIVGQNKGHIICASGCIGGYLGVLSNQILNTEDEEEIYDIKNKIMDFIEWCQNIFGEDNFYLEIQPSDSVEQIAFNKMLSNISTAYDIPMIITTDVHYLNEECREFHKAFLTSDEKDSDREVDSFYSFTRFFKVNELYDLLNYLNEDIITKAILNTKKISDKCENYNWFKEQQIPLRELPPKEEWFNFDKNIMQNYEYIKKIYYDIFDQHTFMIHEIFKGVENKIPKEETNETLERVNIECKELFESSEVMGQPVGAYLTSTEENVETIWKDSIVAPSRGSASGYIINYLIGVTQVNPLKQGMELPHWRFINSERVTFPDIDLDFSSHKKNTVFKNIKEYYQSLGGDGVRVATFKTESSKSAVNTTCRGLHINNDIATAMSALIPVERGKVWSIKDTYYGNKEKGRQPVKEFINLVDQYSDVNLLENMLNIEGLVSGISSHACGSLFIKRPLTETSSYMRTPSGELITSMDLHEEESLGEVKIDLLNTKAMSLIQICLELLIKAGRIEWQGSLKATYDKYISPEVIDRTSDELWDAICEGKIMNLFQFETPVGGECIKKLQPRNLVDLANANSLMRLMNPNGEQPIDKYIRFKNNPNEWDKEMIEYELTKEEREVLHSELDDQCGVCSNQESMMMLLRNPKVCNFSISEADKARKGVAKKMPEVLEEIKQLVFKKGEEIGTSKKMLEYCWNVQCGYSLGYSFSKLHTCGYSLIALQEANLFLKYPSIYWYTSNLLLMSGSLETEEIEGEMFKAKEKSTNYGKTAKAISKLQKENVEVSLPDINKAELGFIPNEKDNNIIFGLKGITGINEEASKIIINNRPYKSLLDFHNRLVLVKREVICSTGKKQMKSLISESQCITLIKGGAFDKLENKNREEILNDYLKILNPPKNSLAMNNLNKVLELGIVPEDKQKYVRYYNFREYLKNFKKIKDETNKKQYWYIIKCEDEEDTEYTNNFIKEHFIEDMEEDVGYRYNEEGYMEILMGTTKKGSFEKVYNSKITSFKKWLNTNECLSLFNKITFDNIKNKYANGSISKWEMDSLSFYYHKHELENVNSEKYQISKFTDLPKQPKIIGYNEYKNIKYPRYELVRICGTVLDRDKNKHMVTLLTPEEVITIKFYSGQFNFYDKNISIIDEETNKKVTLENGWFKRGNKLLITGYRIDDKFYPKRYKNSILKHTVQLIDSIDDKGDLILISDRVKIEDYK